MGALRDMIDILKDAKGVAKDAGSELHDFTGKYNNSSLAAKASEGTLQFPIIISQSIDIETAQTITKALERNYATFAQIVFSMSPTMTYHDGVTAADYLRQFHQNNPKMFEVILRDNAIDYNVLTDENCVIMGATYESATQKVVANNKEQLIDLMESLRHDILNNKLIPRDTTVYNFSDPYLNKRYNSIAMEGPSIYDARRRGLIDDDEYRRGLQVRQDRYRRQRDNVRDDQWQNDYDERIRMDNETISQNTIKNDQWQQNFDETKTQNTFNKTATVAKLKQEQDKLNYQKQRDRVQQHSIDLSRDMLRDNDVRKANELIATTLHIRVRLVNTDNEDVGIVDFIVGIKGIMHPVRSNEMVANVVSACQNNDKIFNFLRWTTGEISFFKDFLFNIDGVKKDIFDLSKGASPWWTTLKRRKNVANLGKVMGKSGLVPNATIVISAEEAEYIKSEYGYDVRKNLFIRKIMNQYFLLGFVIVDSASQIAYFMFDSDSDFQAVTFSALEKAESNDARKFKEMLKAINRV